MLPEDPNNIKLDLRFDIYSVVGSNDSVLDEEDK